MPHASVRCQSAFICLWRLSRIAGRDKYELVPHEAEHGAFGERALPGEGRQQNPNHHRAILALSTAFWDAFLKGDAEAKTWLNGERARSVLEKDDRWQRK